jgi:hypothetical protein
VRQKSPGVTAGGDRTTLSRCVLVALARVGWGSWRPLAGGLAHLSGLFSHRWPNRRSWMSVDAHHHHGRAPKRGRRPEKEKIQGPPPSSGSFGSALAGAAETLGQSRAKCAWPLVHR